MNYLSFDVGIKNLAYCILTPENKIIDWNIINLNKYWTKFSILISLHRRWQEKEQEMLKQKEIN